MFQDGIRFAGDLKCINVVVVYILMGGIDLSWGQSRLYGGPIPFPHSYPSVVSLYDARTQAHICAAAILSESLVLSAWHCLEKHRRTLDNIMIRAGKNNLDRMESMEQVARVVKYASPNDEEYLMKGGSIKLERDIVILMVEPAFTFNKFVKPSILASAGFIGAESLGNTVGWGETGDIDRNVGYLYEEQELLIMDETSCAPIFAEYKEEDILADEVCAGNGQFIEGSCQGDDAAVLFYVEKGPAKAKILLGIMKRRVADCGNGFPNIFSHIPFYSEWINVTMSKLLGIEPEPAPEIEKTRAPRRRSRPHVDPKKVVEMLNNLRKRAAKIFKSRLGVSKQTNSDRQYEGFKI